MPRMSHTNRPEAPSASSMLTDEEEAFRAAVREFAESTLRPRAAAMDAAAVMDREVIDACFSMGLMGVEVP